MKSELLLEMLKISIMASVISTQIIQKLKEVMCCCKKINHLVSIIISFLIGFGYALSFYTANILYAIWIGIFTLVGAENIYKKFNGYFGLKSSNDNEKIGK